MADQGARAPSVRGRAPGSRKRPRVQNPGPTAIAYLLGVECVDQRRKSPPPAVTFHSTGCPKDMAAAPGEDLVRQAGPAVPAFHRPLSHFRPCVPGS